MPRRSDPPGRVRVAKPCAADWDAMVGNDQVRFCTHCNLNVHDLSAMKGYEARRLVRRLEGRLCIRYRLRPGDPAGPPAPLPRLHQIARRASKVAAGAFGAVLTLSAGVTAQTNTRSGAEQPYAFEPARREGASLTGTIFDPHGAAVAGADVVAYDVDRWRAESVRTNSEGVYRFDSLPPGKYTLTAAAPGFQPGKTNQLELLWGLEQTLDATLEVLGPEEVLEVTAEVSGLAGATMGVAAVTLPEAPLVLAAYRDELPTVKRLLADGADANTLDEAVDSTALMEAVERGNVEMVLALLGAGADVNLRNETGRTALMSLTDETPAAIVRALLAAGALVNLRDEDGETALMRAAEREKEDALRLLLAAGAQVDAADGDGRTALMAAAGGGVLENVKALLAAGADWGRKDGEGSTALKLAKDAGHEEVVRLLVAYGAAEE